MQGRAVIIPIAAVALLGAGCATKKFVREEVGKTEAKLGGDGEIVGAALAKLRAEKKVKTSGEKRATTYQAA